MLRLESAVIANGGFRLQADMKIAPGITAVIGPSGAGKSTLLEAVAGFLPLDAGRILWRDQPLAAPPGKRPVAMLFQDHNLFPNLSAAQNVGLGLRGDLRLTQAERAQVAQSLAEVGLEGMDSRRPAQLSGGQQSRCALARALLSGHPIVLLDEPFAALGPALRAELLTLLRNRFAGRVVLMVTHDPADVQQADHLVLVADGMAAAPIDAAQALADPPPALAAYLGQNAQLR